MKVLKELVSDFLRSNPKQRKNSTVKKFKSREPKESMLEQIDVDNLQFVQLSQHSDDEINPTQSEVGDLKKATNFVVSVKGDDRSRFKMDLLKEDYAQSWQKQMNITSKDKFLLSRPLSQT